MQVSDLLAVLSLSPPPLKLFMLAMHEGMCRKSVDIAPQSLKGGILEFGRIITEDEFSIVENTLS